MAGNARLILHADSIFNMHAKGIVHIYLSMYCGVLRMIDGEISDSLRGLSYHQYRT